MLNGLFPIGSVVLLKNSSKRVMIIGFCQGQSSEDGETTVWDYAGCLYPEGYIDANKVFLFNGEQIDKIFSIGYQDEEQFAFKIKIDDAHEQIRQNEKGKKDNI